MKQAKDLLETHEQKRFTECIDLSKNNIHILTGILSGHCYKLKEHLIKRGLAK